MQGEPVTEVGREIQAQAAVLTDFAVDLGSKSDKVTGPAAVTVIALATTQAAANMVAAMIALRAEAHGQSTIAADIERAVVAFRKAIEINVAMMASQKSEAPTN